MSASEVAAHLGVSNRRIRALIASSQLPARQVAGRWMVPAGAVSGFLPKDGGRPMAEHSAWLVLASLAGQDVSVDDLDDVIADYNLRPASNGKIPNILLRAVSNLDAVPRQPGNPHVANAVVSAVDLLDDGDPRAVGEASEMIGRAVHAAAVR